MLMRSDGCIIDTVKSKKPIRQVCHANASGDYINEFFAAAGNLFQGEYMYSLRHYILYGHHRHYKLEPVAK